jgi:hypothetical protein
VKFRRIRGHEGESLSLGALARTRKLSLEQRREKLFEGDVEVERPIGGLAGRNESEAHFSDNACAPINTYPHTS